MVQVFASPETQAKLRKNMDNVIAQLKVYWGPNAEFEFINDNDMASELLIKPDSVMVRATDGEIFCSQLIRYEFDRI